MELYISDIDLSRFNHFLQGQNAQKTFYRVDNLPTIDEMFGDETYHAVLFKQWPGQTVGHWVVLIKFTDTHFEYFDCLGDPPPPEVYSCLEEYGDVTLDFTSRSLMGKENTVCGKWVMFRLFCLPANLEKFLEFFKSWKKSPDSMVSFLVNLPM